MTDDIDIRSGGAVAVDTDSLRAAADDFERVQAELTAVREDLHTEVTRLSGLGLYDLAVWRAGVLALSAEGVCDTAGGLVGGLRESATIYDIVELRVELEVAVHAGDVERARTLNARLTALSYEDPVGYARAILTESAWRAESPAQMLVQTSGWGGWVTPPAVVALAALAGVSRGIVPADARLTGPPPAVQVTASRVGPVAAPSSLQTVVDRMPQGDAQVRVERYTMADGSRQYALYVSGTKPDGGADEPFDMASNLQLYLGERSASYEAVAQALHDAGAQPGDTIYEFAHSQGAMVAGYVALQEGYDTQALVTFGSPVSTEVSSDTLSVQVRHTDDPVVALSNGGSATQVGSSDSIVVQRVADPAPGVLDLLEAHSLDEYRETAAAVDASSDPRTAAVHEMFGQLQGAVSVEAYEYTATRAPTSGPLNPLRVSGAG